jgi:5'-nucleotidase (lipoprotein e(P4) family)
MFQNVPLTPRTAVLVLFTLAIAACDHPADRQNTPALAPAPEINQQNYLSAATLFVQHSAEYKALCYQAFNGAAYTLRNLVSEGGSANLAVVLDLDETVLDNSPYTGWQISSNAAYSDSTWAIWTNKASAEEVPGAGDFLRMADAMGITLFYVSNRDTSALAATIANMAQLQLPQLEAEHFMLKTSTSDKTDRRSAIEAQGYQIVMYVGDNLGDFSGAFDKQSTARRAELTDSLNTRFGTEYIVLPNPVYGTWEGALYNYDRTLTDAQRDSLRMQALKVGI